jgi:hypothetical protein
MTSCRDDPTRDRREIVVTAKLNMPLFEHHLTRRGTKFFMERRSAVSGLRCLTGHAKKTITGSLRHIISAWEIGTIT